MTDPDLRDPRLDEAYRELPGDEPPRPLDERIRAAARRAVGAGPESLAARRQRSWAARWRVPLSLAATVVIAVTLTLMVQEEEQRAFEAPAPPPAPGAPAVVAPPAAPPASGEAKRRDAETPPPRKPGRAAPAPAEVQQAPAADGVAPQAPAAGKLEMRREQVEEPERAGASTPLEAGASAPKPRAAQPSGAPSPAAPSGVSPALSRERAVGDRPTRELQSTPEPPRTPEAWIEEIRRLKAQGRDADATAELAAFRRLYPDYPLPADLVR